MPARSRTSFQKRQKEIQRAEKQRDKAARRLARKASKDPNADPFEIAEPEADAGDVIEPDDQNPQDNNPLAG